MATNFTVLDDLDEMFTAAGIEHRYTPGDLVIIVIRGTHVWTVSEDCILYWGDSPEVCKSRRHDTSWAADAHEYVAVAYSQAQ